MTTLTSTLFTLTLFLMLWSNYPVWGHGRLQDPPSRSTMWRYGFDTPHNYDDHQLYCGGLHKQIKNGGKCGVCGDAWDLPVPRPNEDGGLYGKGVIVKSYTKGQVIDIIVDITANHKGYFEFKLCPVDQPKKRPIDEDCMNKHVLSMADGSGNKYILPEKSGNEKFRVQVVLPKRLTCNRCVLQWTYTAGNNWGKCSDGTGGIGCGPQETFRACADIAIKEDDNSVDSDRQSDEINDIMSDVEPSSKATQPAILLVSVLFWSILGLVLK